MNVQYETWHDFRRSKATSHFQPALEIFLYHEGNRWNHIPHKEFPKSSSRPRFVIPYLAMTNK